MNACTLLATFALAGALTACGTTRYSTGTARWLPPKT